MDMIFAVRVANLVFFFFASLQGEPNREEMVGIIRKNMQHLKGLE